MTSALFSVTSLTKSSFARNLPVVPHVLKQRDSNAATLGPLSTLEESRGTLKALTPMLS